MQADNLSPAEAPLVTSRRNVALAFLGAIGGAGLLKGCGDAPHPLAPTPSEEEDDIGSVAAALTGTSGVRWFDTFADLSATPSTAPADRTLGILLGYLAIGDAGGGLFYWDASSTAAVDGGLVVGNSAQAGRWIRIRPQANHVNACWWGADPSGNVNAQPAIQAAINACTNFRSQLFIPAGTYRISSTLQVTRKGIHIFGQNGASGASNSGTVLQWAGNATDPLMLISATSVTVEEIRFLCPGSSTLYSGLEIGDLSSARGNGISHILVKNCTFDVATAFGGVLRRGVTIGTLPVGAEPIFNLENLVFEDCSFSDAEVGLHVKGGQPYNTVLHRCHFSSANRAGQASGAPYGLGIVISNATSSVHCRNCSFQSLEVGVILSEYAQLTLQDTDSEHCKCLIYPGNQNPSPLSTVAINGGRFVTDRTHLASSGPLALAPGYADFISTSSGQPLVIQNAWFGTGQFQPNFYINARLDQAVVAIGCIFPNLNPVKRTNNFTHQRIGQTVLLGSQGLDSGGTFRVLGTTLGGNNGSGSVSISGSNASAVVNLPSGPESDPNYRVMLSIASVSGTPSAGSLTPYVTSQLAGSFQVTLAAPPGAGNTVNVNWLIVR